MDKKKMNKKRERASEKESENKARWAQMSDGGVGAEGRGRWCWLGVDFCVRRGHFTKLDPRTLCGALYEIPCSAVPLFP